MKARWVLMLLHTAQEQSLIWKKPIPLYFLLCENPDLRIPVSSDVTFHHSPEDQDP
jgi:hypothetical protein